MTQSVAILRHIAYKHHLDGSTIEEKSRIWLIERQVADLMTEFYQLAMRPNYEDLSYDFLEILEKVKLKQVADFLGEGPFVACANVSYADFWLYEYLIKIRTFAPQVWAKFDSLEAFVKRIEGLPRVKEYIAANEPLIFSGPKYSWNDKY